MGLCREAIRYWQCYIALDTALLGVNPPLSKGRDRSSRTHFPFDADDRNNGYSFDPRVGGIPNS